MSTSRGGRSGPPMLGKAALRPSEVGGSSFSGLGSLTRGPGTAAQARGLHRLHPGHVRAIRPIRHCPPTAGMSGPSAGADPYLLDVFFQGQGSYQLGPQAYPHQLSARSGEHACGAEVAAALQGAGLAAEPFGLPYAALGAVHHGARHSPAPAAHTLGLPSAKQARNASFSGAVQGRGVGRIGILRNYLPIGYLTALSASLGSWGAPHDILGFCGSLCGRLGASGDHVPQCAQVKARLGDAGFALVRAKVMAQQEVFVQQMYEMHRVATRQRHLQMACERPHALRAEIALQVPYLLAGLIAPTCWLLSYS